MGVTDDFQYVRDQIKRLNETEFRNEFEARISAIQNSLTACLDKRLQLQEENESLRKQVESMEERQRNEKNLVHQHNAFWPKGAVRGEIAYCTACWDDKGKLITLSRSPQVSESMVGTCPSCRAPYHDVFGDGDAG